MDVVVENVTELSRKLTITLSENEVQPQLEKAYNKLAKEVTIRGFRRGKIPRTVLQKNFKEKVEHDVADELVKATYFDAVEQQGVQAVVHPEILSHSFNDNGSMTYVAKVDIKPTVELKEYKGLTLEKVPTEIAEIEIDREIQNLRKQHAVLRSAGDEHAIARDDIAILDFQGFHDGAAMKEVHNENFSVDVGSGHLGIEFEEKLLGLKKGENTLHAVTFPAAYPNPILAGKTIEFKLDIRDIKERIKPELDDEFAKDVNEHYLSVEDLKNGVRERLQKMKESTAQGDINDKIMHNLLEAHNFPVPERLVRYEMEEMANQYEAQLKRSGMSFESMGINRQELLEKNRDAAEKRVRGDFILKKICEVEKIELTSEDLERGYQRIATQYNMTIPDVKQFFQRREETLPFMNELLNEKALDFLHKEAKFVPSSPAGENVTQ